MLKEFAKRLMIGTAIALAAGAARHAWPQGVPIGALPNATVPLTGAELTILSQNGITSKTTVSNLIAPGLIIPNNTVLGNVSGTTQAAVAVNASQLTTLLGLGSAAFANTGSTGHALPYLDVANTWSGLQTFSGGVSLTSITVNSLTVTATLTGPDSGTWTSGGLNGVALGTTTPAAGKFTTLQATGNTVLVTTQITGLTTLQTATLSGFASMQSGASVTGTLTTQKLTATNDTVLVTTQITGLTTLQTATLSGFATAQAGFKTTTLQATNNTILVTTQISGLTSLLTANFTGFATMQGGLQVTASGPGTSLTTTTISGLTTTQTTVIGPATAGTINNVVIGGSTPLAGTFTALTATGNTSLATTQISGLASTQAGVLEPLVLEAGTNSATAATGTINMDGLTNTILEYTTASTGNFVINLRGNSGQALNNVMATGNRLTFVFECTNTGTPHFLTTVLIDSVVQTVKWLGGVAPSAGNANSVDRYTITVNKTGSGTYEVTGSQEKFA